MLGPVSYTHLDVYKRQVDLPCCENGAAIDDDNVDNYIEYLPVHRRGILIVDDSENKERIKCLRVTDNNTDGDKTRITDVDRLYNLIIMCGNPVKHCYEVMEPFEKTNSYYNSNNKMSLIVNELCRRKTRLLFDDGG